MSAHTPGPWWFGIAYEPERGSVPLDYRSGGYCDNPMIFGAGGEHIVGCGEYNVFEKVDDLRLMLAAPMMLAALRDAEVALSRYEFAGAKSMDGGIGAIDSALANIRDAIAKATEAA